MGRATALFLAQKGFRVYAGSRTPSKLLDIESDSLSPIELDITKSQQIYDAIEPIEKIDILINNAGTYNV
jgi:NADP-dependent 3-hydroxy acid dehydrogenase YdfG